MPKPGTAVSGDPRVSSISTFGIASGHDSRSLNLFCSHVNLLTLSRVLEMEVARAYTKRSLC